MYYKTLAKFSEWKTKFRDDIRGVTAVEYAIIAVVMSGIVLAAFNSTSLRGGIERALAQVESTLDAADGTGGSNTGGTEPGGTDTGGTDTGGTSTPSS